MSALNAWQRIDRVVSGKPFGNGSDGALSSATIPTMSAKSCSGTATSTTLTADTDASPFSVGDILLLHQTRGTGAGQWEINKVDSVGTDEYTLNQALNYTYTDSGASQAQATKISQYTDATVETGTWTLADWAGNTGGTLVFAANGAVTVTGDVTGVGKGFDGGIVSGGDRYNGEGTVAASSAEGGQNGNGGSQGTDASGAGGGHGAAGTNGSTGQAGGAAVGSADLISLNFGGGGGAGDAGNPSVDGAGGPGSGAVIIFANSITLSGTTTLTGNVGANGGNGRAGGGGAGGAALLVCATATLGTNKIVSLGGAGGTADQGNGGAGAVGRIAVHHSGTVTGTTNPTFDDTTDTTLVESGGNFFALL